MPGRLDDATRNLPDDEDSRGAPTPAKACAECRARLRAFFTTKEVGKGTGLGLSQIHGFAARPAAAPSFIRGSAKVRRLRLILPRTDKPMLPPAEAMPVASGCAGKRVLLVDDNDQVRQFAQSLLAELGCDVVSAGCGAEALELLGRERSTSCSPTW
jgi:CheY-like chemotaxis protein